MERDMKELGWIARCEKITEILTDGHEVAGKIIGSAPLKDDWKAGETSADKLDVELAMILSSLQELVSQLERIASKF